MTGRNVFWRRSQHGEGLIPTTAAKLFQPQPKRNTPRRETASGDGGGRSGRSTGCRVVPVLATSRAQGCHVPVTGEWSHRLFRYCQPLLVSVRGTSGRREHGREISSLKKPHLLAGGVARVGQAVSSSKAWRVCQTLETEIGGGRGVGAEPTQPAPGRKLGGWGGGCPGFPTHSH